MVRFVSQLGFSGYSAFRQALRDFVDTDLNLLDRKDLSGLKGPDADRLHRVVLEETDNLQYFYEIADMDALSAAVTAGDALDTACASAAFRFHLDLHLEKEDAHLFRLVRERVPVPDQGKALGLMSSTVPQDRFPEVVAWMFPLLGHDDRENMIRIWEMVMPPPVFARAKQLIQKAIGNDWAELTRRIPTLA